MSCDFTINKIMLINYFSLVPDIIGQNVTEGFYVLWLRLQFFIGLKDSYRSWFLEWRQYFNVLVAKIDKWVCYGQLAVHIYAYGVINIIYFFSLIWYLFIFVMRYDNYLPHVYLAKSVANIFVQLLVAKSLACKFWKLTKQALKAYHVIFYTCNLHIQHH